jgi:hypothetical protein
MTIFFQHVGEKGGQRDFPRTIGTPQSGLVVFTFDNVRKQLGHLPETEMDQLERDCKRLAPDGFQIWSIPSGAKSVLRTLVVGDYLLLLESVGPGGVFAYGGIIVARPSQECFDLSVHLWGENRFPLIVFMRGNLTSYRWYDFCEALGYRQNWNPAGMTSRVLTKRLLNSPYTDEAGLIVAALGGMIELEPESASHDLALLDIAELDMPDEEGRQVLRAHLMRERSARLIRNFKAQLKDFSCTACGFDFRKVYGELGHRFIEAHHKLPLSEGGSDRVSLLDDLEPVCSNCYRILHRRYPALTTEDLKHALAESYEAHSRGKP